jgi:hypothetical protein
MRKTLIGLWLLLAVSVCAAQNDKNKSEKEAKPDFSGTWILDKNRSDSLDHDLTLIIVHREPEIKITSRRKSKGRENTDEQTYRIDGKAERGSTRVNQDSEQRILWWGKTLVRRSVNQTTFPGSGSRAVKTVTIEEWSLSKDGKILTRTIAGSLAEETSPQGRYPRIAFRSRHIFRLKTETN